MDGYIEIDSNTSDDREILIEIGEIQGGDSGFEDAGIPSIRTSTGVFVKLAQDRLSDSLKRIIHCNIQPVLEAIHALPEQPSEIEVAFGIKVVGECNFAVGKAAGESNYNVRLVWKQK